MFLLVLLFSKVFFRTLFRMLSSFERSLLDFLTVSFGIPRTYTSSTHSREEGEC
eukprot:m.40807 g.40807  ORF g.40807 m.40807 type:complete len:54 (-) comp46049_c0_seq1:1052-1213(-)